MSKELLPTFDQIKSTIDSTKEQEYLSPANRAKALEHELDQLEQINSTIDNVIESMDATSSHLDTINTTSQSTNKLLDLWIKILSQTSYTTKLLSDKNWKGVSHHDEEYASQIRKFEELNKRYNAEKQKREQEKEAQKQKKLAMEQRAKEREATLRRRVYGSSASTSVPSTARGGTGAKRGTSSNRGGLSRGSSVNRGVRR